MCARCENLSKPTTTAPANPPPVRVPFCVSVCVVWPNLQNQATKQNTRIREKKEVAIKSRINSFELEPLSQSQSASQSRCCQAATRGSINSKTQLLNVSFTCTNAFKYIQFINTNKRLVCCRCRCLAKDLARKQK